MLSTKLNKHRCWCYINTYTPVWRKMIGRNILDKNCKIALLKLLHASRRSCPTNYERTKGKSLKAEIRTLVHFRLDRDSNGRLSSHLKYNAICPVNLWRHTAVKTKSLWSKPGSHDGEWHTDVMYRRRMAGCRNQRVARATTYRYHVRIEWNIFSRKC